MLSSDILNSIQSFGLEATADGQKHIELEYTFYGKLDDFSVLDSEIVTSKEEQDQYFIPIDNDTIGARIRRINKTQHVLTVKARREGVKGKEEVEQEISEDMFNLLRESSDKGYRKIRYVIPAPNTELKWEVDVFLDANEQRHPWVKLDLEVTSEDQQPPQLPFKLTEKIVAQGSRKTEAENLFIEKLWGKDWNIKTDEPLVTGELTDQQTPPKDKSLSET